MCVRQVGVKGCVCVCLFNTTHGVLITGGVGGGSGDETHLKVF